MRVPLALLAAASAIGLSGCAYGLYDDGSAMGVTAPMGVAAFQSGSVTAAVTDPTATVAMAMAIRTAATAATIRSAGTGIIITRAPAFTFTTVIVIATFGVTSSAATGRIGPIAGGPAAARRRAARQPRIGRVGAAIVTTIGETTGSAPTLALVTAATGLASVRSTSLRKRRQTTAHGGQTAIVGSAIVASTPTNDPTRRRRDGGGSARSR